MTEQSFWAFVLMLTPVVETRGGIPVGLALGVQPTVLFALSAVSAIIIYFLGRIVLEQFYTRILVNQPFVKRQITKLRVKLEPYIKRFGFLGLILFVAIPLPGTGAYGGTGASWVLGLDKKRSFVAILCGALISATIIMLIAGKVI